MRNIGVLIVAGALFVVGCHHDNGNNTGNPDLSAAAGDMMGIGGNCLPAGNACASNAACCSGTCDPTMHICAVTQCLNTGSTCAKATDCCNLNCTNGTCSATQCVSDNQPCTAGGAACCSTQCVNGSCAPLSMTCHTAGNQCTTDLDCCSGKCNPMTMTCAAPSQISYCTQAGDICFHDNECCTGVCSIASGATAGTCAHIQSSCSIDGTTCTGCSTSPRCCSGYCAPYGTAGSTVCQPASGCHVLGDLCHTTSDCCGGDATSGLAGAGLVKCIPDPNFPQIGTCSMANPNNCPANDPTCQNTCQPEGDVCHYKGVGGCSSNSYPANCCSAPGASSGVCKLDSLGVPRCFSIPTNDMGMQCVQPGGNCASSADCCNNAPCVPDATGHLHCGSMCVPQSGVCTTTADCCTGLLCVVPAGSLNGSCVAPTSPSPDGGTSTGDGGGPAPQCALAGQSCSTTVSCCAGQGSCTRPISAGGTPCAAGNTDCLCTTPII